MKSLTPPQIEALMGMLRPDQAAVIGEVHDAYVKRESALVGRFVQGGHQDAPPATIRR